MINHFSQQIINRLKEYAGPRAQVDYLPENVGSFAITHAEAAYLVHYSGSTFSTSSPRIQRKMSFDIYVATKRLSGPSGLATHVERVVSWLHGAKLEGASGQLLAVRDRFTALMNGSYQHVITFELVAPYQRNYQSETPA